MHETWIHLPASPEKSAGSARKMQRTECAEGEMAFSPLSGVDGCWWETEALGLVPQEENVIQSTTRMGGWEEIKELEPGHMLLEM